MLGRCLRISDKQVLRSVVQGLPWLVLFLNFDLRHNLVRHVLNAVKGVCGLVGGPGPQWHNVPMRFMLLYHIGLYCVQRGLYLWHPHILGHHKLLEFVGFVESRLPLLKEIVSM